MAKSLQTRSVEECRNTAEKKLRIVFEKAAQTNDDEALKKLAEATFSSKVVVSFYHFFANN